MDATTLSGYRILVFRSLLLGAFAGVFAVVYLAVVEFLTEEIWQEWESDSWFSGSIWTVLIPIVAGLIVGLLYRGLRLPSRFPGFIEDLEDGYVSPKTAPGALLVSVISLVGGASLGPEAPLGTAGGAAGTWLGRRDGADAEGVRQLSFAGISGAFGGLLSTPIGGPLLAFELEHEQSSHYYVRQLVPGIVAGAVGFGIVYPVLGTPFKGLLTIEPTEFKSWMLLAALGLGIFAVAAAFVVGRIMTTAAKLFHRLDRRPVLRGVAGGGVVGVIAFVHPLTLFSGQTTVPRLLDDFETLGILMLVALAILKAVSLGVSLSSGFYGGPIFPMFFIGAALGLAIHLMIPAIPLALAVGSLMAGVGAALALLPVSLAVLTGILIESGVEMFGAIVVASATAYVLRVVLATPNAEGDVQQAASSVEPRS